MVYRTLILQGIIQTIQILQDLVQNADTKGQGSNSILILLNMVQIILILQDMVQIIIMLQNIV